MNPNFIINLHWTWCSDCQQPTVAVEGTLYGDELLRCQLCYVFELKSVKEAV